MSRSEYMDPGEPGHVIIEAPADVEVRVTSGHFDEVTRSYGRVEMNVPPGIYVVRWAGGGASQQKMARVFPGANPVMRYENRSFHDEATTIREALKPADDDASPAKIGLLLCIPWDDEKSLDAFTRRFKLTRHDKLSHTPREITECSPRYLGGMLALAFEVEPGAYVLRYDSVERIGVEQSLHVYPRRTTVAMLGLSKSARPEGIGEKAQFRAREGIDPSMTRVISVAMKLERASVIERDLRMSGTMLEQLALAKDGLELPLVNQAQQSKDPFVRTYAIALMLGALRPNSPEPLYDYIDPTIAVRVDRLLDLECFEMESRAADIDCAFWRLAVVNMATSDRRLDQLTLPPMLARSWQWAAGWSLIETGERHLSTELVSASVGRVPVKPWLVWRAKTARTVENRMAAMKSPAARALGQSVAQAQEVTSAFSDAVATIQESVNQASTLYRRAQDGLRLPSLDFAKLSETTQKLAANVAILEAGENQKKLTLLEGLVLSMRTPMSVLAAEIQRSLDEIKNASAAIKQSLESDDPWKGRFGKRAEANGYRLVLEAWKPANNPDFLTLDMAVVYERKRAPLPRGTVRFFLHPTFSPFTQDVAWTERTAAFSCYAYGAFTIGAQVSDGTKLELDLARDERLPDWFRKR